MEDTKIIDGGNLNWLLKPYNSRKYRKERLRYFSYDVPELVRNEIIGSNISIVSNTYDFDDCALIVKDKLKEYSPKFIISWHNYVQFRYNDIAPIVMNYAEDVKDIDTFLFIADCVRTDVFLRSQMLEFIEKYHPKKVIIAAYTMSNKSYKEIISLLEVMRKHVCDFKFKIIGKKKCLNIRRYKKYNSFTNSYNCVIYRPIQGMLDYLNKKYNL